MGNPYLRIVFGVLTISLMANSAFSQNYFMTTGIINTCGGSFQDDNNGGAEGSPYSNTNYTFTICPDNPGDAIQISFAAFNLQTSPNPNNSDRLYIFDGPDINANSLGSYSGNQLQGLDVTATITNPTGCLTFVFDCNTGNTGNFPGWEGLISCETPCATPTAQSVISDPEPQGITQSVGVCLDAPVTFSDNGSFAEPGFNLDSYNWNFDDGTIDSTSGPVVSHIFTEPGEYIVTLTVQDNNGCGSLNLDPLQVLVSTIPIFNTEFTEEICLGTVANLNGAPVQSVTWTALPPQVVSGQTYLADGAGFAYSTTLSFDFFDPDQVLEDCSDLLSILVNMEHSYMGDLEVQLTCPDGTTVIMVGFPENGGGGTFLGEAIDDGSTDPGVGYDYWWVPDATNGTWGENAQFGGSLESGEYESWQNLCAFVGCPLNGDWTLTITDNLAIDNGYIFYWGINFDPTLFPGITTFTPIIGLQADSSYWEGPFITNTSIDGNQITVFPDAPGSYDYTYYATNNFGCTFDTTVTVTVNPNPEAWAGDDIFLCLGDDTSLQAGIVGQDLPSCSAVSGIYDYCYLLNSNATFTYCPDNPGDGITNMSISFLAGQMENFWDFINIYDGNNVGAPLLASLTGLLSGTYTATGPTGCITIQIVSDGFGACQDGFYEEMIYEIGCSSGGPAYDILWSPGTALSSTFISQPTVTGLVETTTYDLTIYPAGFPECATSDQVTVFVGEDVDAGDNAVGEFCGSYGNIPLFGLLGGNPDAGGVWTDENGEEITGLFDTITDDQGVFTYTITDAGCEEFSTVEILINEVEILASNDTTVCINGTATLSAQAISGNLNQPLTYIWNFGDFVGDEFSFEPTSNPTPVVVYATFDQNCITNTEEILVFIYAPLQMNLMNDITVCLEDSLDLSATNVSGGLVPYTFTWQGDNGDVVIGNPSTVQLLEDVEYCLTLADACETTPITDCVTVDLEEIVAADFIADVLNGCNPVTVNFQGFATNPEIISSVIWDFGDGTFANTVNSASHTYFEPGYYDVSLTITSDAGCIYDETAPNYIASYPLPIASFNSDPQTALLPNTTFEFNNLSFGAENSNWTFGPYGFSEQDSPEFTFPVNDAQIIEVQLIVENIFGCLDTVTRNVFINEDFVIYVPNAFTPDNDGLNDFFFVLGEDVNKEEYEIQIFDRWGQLIWESNDILQPWDGSVLGGGYYVQEEVYVWKIETRSLSTSDSKKLNGFVTVLR